MAKEIQFSDIERQKVIDYCNNESKKNKGIPPSLSDIVKHFSESGDSLIVINLYLLSSFIITCLPSR